MRINKPALRITHLIGEWINTYLPSQNIRSAKTAKNYEYAISLFLDFLEKEKHVDCISIVPDDFNPQNMEEWLRWMARCQPKLLPRHLQQQVGSIEDLSQVCCKN